MYLLVIVVNDYTNVNKILEKFISIQQGENIYYLFGYEKDIPSHHVILRQNHVSDKNGPPTPHLPMFR